jgi:hypothetical protein
VAGSLGNQHDDGEVVEEFERADDALGPLLAVRAGGCRKERRSLAQRSRRVVAPALRCGGREAWAGSSPWPCWSD